MMKNAVILFSHGSLLCGSSRLLETHASRLRAEGIEQIEIGFLNYSKPLIEDAIERCLIAGAHSITIVPYFLVAGKFVLEDLPARLESARARWPQVELKMAKAIEDAPPMIDAILDSAEKAVSVLEWQTSAIADSQSMCEKRIDCPLYGTQACQVQTNIHG